MPSKNNKFDVQKFLSDIGDGRTILRVRKKQIIYAQGAKCDALFYIQKGKIKLTVVSKAGKEATIAILNPADFFGEGCLAAQPLRMSSATALTDCELMRIDNKAMMSALHRENTRSDMFVAYLLDRNIRYEEDLVDQLFNSSEKRLARILLLLARFGTEGKREKVIPRISQETLAEMVGTTPLYGISVRADDDRTVHRTGTCGKNARGGIPNSLGIRRFVSNRLYRNWCGSISLK